MLGKWRDLPFVNREDGPPKLLFKFIRVTNGFELYVTDLIHAWKALRTTDEDLKEVARQERCPIDPNEDASQIDVLISKLEEGLSANNGGRCKVGPGYRDPSDEELRDAFMLAVTVPLPAPLKPLLWTFHLYQHDRMLLTRELLVPALAAQLSYQTQVEDLKRRMQEKDHVISRLMDKVDQSSIDLSLVFPGFGSGRKGLNAKQATKVVPGLSNFDAGRWQERFTIEELAPAQSLVDALRRPGSNRLNFESPCDRHDGDSAWKPFGTPTQWEQHWVDIWGEYPTFTDDQETRKKINGAKQTPKLLAEESTDAFEVSILSQFNQEVLTRHRSPKVNTMIKLNLTTHLQIHCQPLGEHRRPRQKSSLHPAKHQRLPNLAVLVEVFRSHQLQLKTPRRPVTSNLQHPMLLYQAQSQILIHHPSSSLETAPNLVHLAGRRKHFHPLHHTNHRLLSHRRQARQHHPEDSAH